MLAAAAGRLSRLAAFLRLLLFLSAFLPARACGRRKAVRGGDVSDVLPGAFADTDLAAGHGADADRDLERDAGHFPARGLAGHGLPLGEHDGHGLVDDLGIRAEFHPA